MKALRGARVVLLAAVSVLGAGIQECGANAIIVTNVSVAGVQGGTADVQFDISWSNSWNLSWTDDGGATTVANWDAAWVFLKFKTTGGNWRHGMLASTGHTATAGTIIDIGSNGTGTNVGAIIRRDSQGSGALSAQGIRLRWDFAQSSLGGTTDVDISVHAIEMVYIPQGRFALGSGGGETAHFYKYPYVSDAYYVTNESAIAIGSSINRLYATGNIGSDIPAGYPKGYAPFYCMKYEISQGQYASFLNYISPGDATVRYPSYAGNSRYTISVVSNLYVATAPDRACNYLSLVDVCAYLDWACLRPMTELEYEKACRGTMPPEPNEYAWGTTTITKLTGITGADGSGSETAAPTTANCNYSSGTNGPVRVGIFAVQGASRQQAGAGYYGVMELSGNVSEFAVWAYGSGLTFIPQHGDGNIALQPDGWPGYDGFMERGGAWDNSPSQVSSRGGSAGSTRDATTGGRGVRSWQP